MNFEGDTTTIEASRAALGVAAQSTQSRPGLHEASPLDRPHRLTVERYRKMIEAGVFADDRRVFLWKGILVTKMTKGQPHNIALGDLLERMIGLVPPGCHVRQEQPVILADDSQPEPDLSIIRGSRRDYPRTPPTPADVLLIAEVADTSLSEDRGEMAVEYARAAILTYWIVNIPDRCVEVYTEPTGPGPAPLYRVGRRYGPSDEVPVVLDGREVGRVAVADILP